MVAAEKCAKSENLILGLSDKVGLVSAKLTPPPQSRRIHRRIP